MKLTIKLILLFSVLTGAIKAQQKPIVAVCDMGKGCTFQLSKLTNQEADGILGKTGKYNNMSKDAMIVFAKKDGKWIDYVEDKLSRSALDRLYGGDGFTMIYPFNPYIQPLDGQWKVAIGSTSGSACFVDINAMISRSLSGTSEGGVVNFPKPFNVTFLMNNPSVKWRMINPSQYQAVLDFAAGPTSPMKLVYDITIINEEKITGLFTFTIKVPTKDPCISKIPVTYTCVKPNPGQREKRDQIDPFAEKFNIERLPDDSKRPNVERLPDDPKPGDDLLPDGKLKPKPDLLPDRSKKPVVKRLPDERKKPNIERLPDDPKPKASDLLPNGKLKPKPELLPDRSKRPTVERLPDERKKAKIERIQ